MTPSTNSPERRPPRKATLFCPNCNHESPINGDWVIHVHANSIDYECPDCEVVINSRPDKSGVDAESDGVLQFGDAD